MQEKTKEYVMEWLRKVKENYQKGATYFLETARLLYEGKKDCLYSVCGYKNMKEFLDSKMLGIGHSQGYKLIKAWEYVLAHKLDIEKAKEIGVEKLALGTRLSSVHPGGLKAEHIKEHSKAELEAMATHLQKLEFYVESEKVPVIEQAIEIVIKKEWIKNRGEALYFICVDFLSGHGWEGKRPKTTLERMQDIWAFWRELRYPDVDHKIADQNYPRYAKILKKLAQIEKIEEEKGEDAEIVKKGIKEIWNWYSELCREKGFAFPDLSKIASKYPEWRQNPQDFKVKTEFNPAVREKNE